MIRHIFPVVAVALATTVALPAIAASADMDPGGTSISGFKAQSLFRAVELKWQVETPLQKGVRFQIVRSDAFAEGPYKEVAVVPYNEGSREYTYVDKGMPSESKYFYKLVVIGMGEAYGPVSARPFFSLPAT